MLKLLTYNIICGCGLLQGYGKEIKNLKLFSEYYWRWKQNQITVDNSFEREILLFGSVSLILVYIFGLNCSRKADSKMW